ncbi:hypothetical protein SAMN05518801_1522 [Novosphingobium sp. CF614]|uniref:hypothetical protein n=1 Tax=Novosphingobium sp. CF614 TaxID=1884364 RepID=UPI0008E54E1A|nr:hypothetical protein [Novosphingobium sp. CF614]SFG54708.1 hypothetical protein SAMN05518801_1522 [Novosphingobium sp. CF614]
MNRPRDLNAGTPDIATRAELLQRLSARARPLPEPAPAQNPMTRLEVMRDQAQHNEDKIAQLRDSLGSADHALTHDYVFAALEGRSRADFERSR